MTDKQIQHTSYKKLVAALDLLDMSYREHTAETGTIYLSVDNIGKIRVSDHGDVYGTARHDISPSGDTVDNIIKIIESKINYTVKQAKKKSKRIQQLRDFSSGKFHASEVFNGNSIESFFEWAWGMKYESRNTKAFSAGINYVIERNV